MGYIGDDLSRKFGSHPEDFHPADEHGLRSSSSCSSSLATTCSELDAANSFATEYFAMPAISSTKLPLLFPVALLSVPSISVSLSRRFYSNSGTLHLVNRSKWIQPSVKFFSNTTLLWNHPQANPGWTNILRAYTPHCPQIAISSVHSMATADFAPSIVVYVTVPNKETGTKLAHSIIENKLAACVNQVPGVESTYWWQGKVETDSEILLIIKTRQGLLSELTAHVNANHPYDTPEVIAIPIIGGSDKYLKWIEDNTQKEQVAQE